MSNINSLIKAILDLKSNDTDAQYQKVLSFITSNSKNLNKLGYGDEAVNDMTALTAACSVGDKRVIEALLHAGADVNTAGKNKNTPLMVAAEDGRIEIVELLLKHKADVRQVNKDTYTALMLAMYVMNHEIVKILLDKIFASVNIDDGESLASDSLTLSKVFYIAASKGYESIVDVFLNSNFNLTFYSLPVVVSSEDKYVATHNTALTMALHNSHNSIAKKIINKGYMVDSVKLGSVPPLFAVTRNSEITELLITKGADTRISFQGKPLFFRAIESNDLRMLELIYKANPIDLESFYDDETPLTYAVLLKCDTSVVFLLQHKVKVDAENKKGETALSLALTSCSPNIIGLLTRAKANMRFIYNETNDTPLMVAARRNMFDVVKVIADGLTLGQITLKNKKSETALSIAAGTLNLEMTLFLAKKIDSTLFPPECEHLKFGHAYYADMVMNFIAMGFDFDSLRNISYYLYQPQQLPDADLYMTKSQIATFATPIIMSKNPIIKYAIHEIQFRDLYNFVDKLNDLTQVKIDEENCVSSLEELSSFIDKEEFFMNFLVKGKALNKRIVALKQDKLMQIIGTLISACVYNLLKVESHFDLDKFIDSVDDDVAKKLYISLNKMHKLDGFLFEVVDQFITFPRFEKCKTFILERIIDSFGKNNRIIQKLNKKAKLSPDSLVSASVTPMLGIQAVDSVLINRKVEEILARLENKHFIANVVKQHNGGISIEEKAYSEKLNEKWVEKSGIRPMPNFSESNPIIEEIALSPDQRFADVVAIIEANKKFVNLPNEFGLMPLYVAINLKKIKDVSALVDAGADVNFITEFGESILYKAVCTGHQEIIEVILKKQPNLNILVNGMTALAKAAELDLHDIVKILVEAGADVNVAKLNCFTPLMAAASKGNLEVVKYLLKNNAVVDQRVNDQTPLCVAVVNGFQAVVDCLLAAGATPNALVDGKAATYVATMNKQPGILRSLIKAGGVVNVTYNHITLLRGAVQNDDWESVQILLQAKVNPDHRNAYDNMTALQVAAMNEYVDVVKVFCNPYAKINKAIQAEHVYIDSSCLPVCMLPDYGSKAKLSLETKLILSLINAGMSVQNNHLTKWLSHPASEGQEEISFECIRDVIGLMANKKIDTLTDDDYNMLPSLKFLRMLMSCQSNKFQTKYAAVLDKSLDAAKGFDEMMSLFQGVFEIAWAKTYLLELASLTDKKVVRSLDNPALRLSLDVLSSISSQLVHECCKSIKLTLLILQQLPLDGYEIKRLNTIDSYILRLFDVKESCKQLLTLASHKPERSESIKLQEELTKILSDVKAKLNNTLLLKTEAVADEAKKIKEELRRKKIKDNERKVKAIETQRKEKEEADRKEAVRKEKEAAAQKEAERKKMVRQEIEQRKIKEEAARKEAELRKAKEDAMRIEMHQRKAKEDALRREAEQRKAKEEALRREEEQRKAKEENARKEAARIEADRKAKEAAAQKEAEIKAKETSDCLVRMTKVKSYFDFLSVEDCYLVGGAVVNLLVNKLYVNDYDFVAKCNEQEAAGLLQKKFSLNENLPDKTINLYTNPASRIDFTRVFFTQSEWLAEDAKKRDFTKCAVYCDKQGKLYDPTGRGISDIKAGVLSMIGDAETFYADPIRLLRALKYIAVDNDRPDDLLLDAIKKWTVNYLLIKSHSEKKHFFIKYIEFTQKYVAFAETLKKYSLFDVIETEYKNFTLLEQQMASQQYVKLYQPAMYYPVPDYQTRPQVQMQHYNGSVHNASEQANSSNGRSQQSLFRRKANGVAVKPNFAQSQQNYAK